MPLTIFIFSRISFKANIYVDNEAFMKKWGSLYYEFKNNKGFWSTQYYTLYTIRRIAYMLALLFMSHNLYLQYSIHLSFTILQLIYVFYFTPFKEKDVLFSLAIGEICTLLVIVLSFFFIAETTPSTRRLVESVIVIIIITSLACDMLLSLVMIVKEAKKFVGKIKEKYFQRKILPRNHDDERSFNKNYDADKSFNKNHDADKSFNIKINSFMNSPHNSFMVIEEGSMSNE